MKYNIYVDSLENMQCALQNEAVDEIIIAPLQLSRYGKFPLEDIDQALKLCLDSNTNFSIELDRILSESEFTNYIGELEKYFSFDNLKIRCLDPGLAYYLLNETNAKILWIAEMGNHNISGLEAWEKYFSHKLDKIILCPELEESKIKEINTVLNVKTELLALGPILLFYTPRHLLAPYYDNHEDPVQKQQLSINYLEVSANSEESPHKGFPIKETKSGTYMFNPKDLCVLDYWKELNDSGLDSIRLDFRDSPDFKMSFNAFIAWNKNKSKENLKSLKDSFSRSFIRGFFKANKSDVLFKNLKNQHNLRVDSEFLGDVIETQSGSHCVIEVKANTKDLQIGDIIQYKTPDKKWKSFEVKSLKDLSGNTLRKAHKGDFVVLPHSQGVSSNTKVYWDK